MDLLNQTPHEDPKRHGEALSKIFFFRNMPLNNQEKALLKGANFIQSIGKLRDGIRKDINDNTHGKYTFLASETFEALGNFGFDLIDFMGIDELVKKGGKLSYALDQTDGVRELLTGVAKHIGNGKFDVEIVTHYLDGVRSLAKVELKRRHMLTGRIVQLNGYQALGIAIYKSARGDALNVDLVTEYVDAVNNLAWTGLGMAACSGNYNCTAAIQEFGKTMAKVLRKTTEPLFVKAVAAMSGNKRKTIQQYLTLQNARAAKGMKVQRITDVYSRKILIRNSMSKKEIFDLDTAALNLQIHLNRGLAQEVSTQQTTETGNLGGVDLATKKPIIIEEDMSAITRSVLR